MDSTQRARKFIRLLYRCMVMMCLMCLLTIANVQSDGIPHQLYGNTRSTDTPKWPNFELLLFRWKMYMKGQPARKRRRVILTTSCH